MFKCEKILREVISTWNFLMVILFYFIIFYLYLNVVSYSTISIIYLIFRDLVYKIKNFLIKITKQTFLEFILSIC